jgi:alkylglycerol monooxygenase
MKLNFFAFAVPLFLFFMLLEYFVSRKKKLSTHNLEESVANLNVGIAERLTDLLTTGAFFFVFTWVHDHFAIFNIKATPLTWLLLFICTDLAWYWYHRYGHEVNLFWSAHVVHHQSNDFNFTVSARITVFQAVVRGIFWSVLPLIGFPPQMIAIFLLIHGMYPFFTHTELIGKLGWLEYIIVTPSHHRVHHSSNPEYLDKNYGDMLIIWDKLFGTFAAERSKPVYGLTSPLNSHSFLWQHFHFFLEMIVAFRSAKGFKNKMKIIFGKPDNINPAIRVMLERKMLSKLPANDQYQSKFISRLVTVQTAITLIILFLTILLVHHISNVQLCILSVFIFISVINSGAIIEQKKWVFHLDYSRLILITAFVYTLHPYPALIYLALFLLSCILVFYRSVSTWYYAQLYNYS